MKKKRAKRKRMMMMISKRSCRRRRMEVCGRKATRRLHEDVAVVRFEKGGTRLLDTPTGRGARSRQCFVIGNIRLYDSTVYV